MKASSKITHMSQFSPARQSFHRALGTVALILGMLAGCAGLPSRSPAPVSDRSPGAVVAPAAAAPVDATVLMRPRSRWVAAEWADLPGWSADRSAELWPALLAGCARPALDWAAVCRDAAAMPTPDHDSARAFLQQRLLPYRVESPDETSGNPVGLITGYYEPLLDAQRLAQPGFRVPLHRPPADLDSRKPYWTRQQLDTLPAAQASLRSREIAYLADPLDALVIQIQGSGRLRITEPDGSVRMVRLAYAGHNDHGYKSVGRWLIDQGELSATQASWPGIKAWARRNPRRLNELLWSNPRVVFFREEAMPQPTLGPRGAQGVPLTPGRSIAVDPLSVPYGTPVWLDTTEPLSSTPLRRLVMAQDTGGAIVGAVRADFFWGWGDEAEAQAGRMKQPLRMWALWPR